MTDPPEAFLSYTRLDNEYFGGAITSLRRLLELGVQVVTGDRTFNIFQDVDGIEFGQQWKKRLTEAISTSRFLIPIVTPLFFKSDPCRDELKQFIEHEKSLGRDDLILPIYFVTAPVLERPELLKDDTLASEIGSRQRYDWRVQADLPPNDPQIRRAVRELAEKIATAIARTSGPAPAPARHDDDAVDGEASKLVKSLEPERETKKRRKLVLWVDDRPNNNIIERHAMAAYNIDFVLAQSTGQALAELRKQQFDAIISDMNRPPDSRAGYTLLEAVRDSGDQTPYFIYAGSRDPAHEREARSRGAQGATNKGDELLQMLLEGLVFLSYAREDRAAVQKIRTALEAAGVVVLDSDAPHGGDDWKTKLPRIIRQCSLFVPVISRQTRFPVQGFLRLEWSLALEKEEMASEDQKFILPIVIDDTTPEDVGIFRAFRWYRLPGGDTTPEFVSQVQKLYRKSRLQ